MEIKIGELVCTSYEDWGVIIGYRGGAYPWKILFFTDNDEGAWYSEKHALLWMRGARRWISENEDR